MGHQVFISFSSKDKKLAEKIYSRLEKNGISCWISSKNIPPGADYQACIVEAINDAQIVVLIFSAQANDSNEVAKELSLASKKTLIPTRIEDVIPAGAFQYQLSNRQFIDLFEDFDNRLEELSDRIKAALNNSTPVTQIKKKALIDRKKVQLSFAAITGLTVLGAGSWFTLNHSTPKPPDSPVAVSVGTAPPDQQTAIAPSLPAAQTISTSSITTPQTVVATVPEPEVSEKIKGLVTMLKDTSGYARLTSLQNFKETLPSNINFREAEALLKNTDANRPNAISILAGNLATNLGGVEIAAILAESEGFNRLTALTSIAKAGKIKRNLSADEASSILKRTIDNRTNSIAVLSENLASNLGGNEIATILGDAEGYNRAMALNSISKAGKIKNGLTAEEAKSILKSTGDNRTNSIAILVESLATNQGGSDVAIILGELEGYNRAMALKSISKSGKIKSGLLADDAKVILKNTGDNRTNAIAAIAENLAGNQGANDVATILGDTGGYNRFIALKSISKSEKIKSAMKLDELQAILKGMDASTADAQKELAPYVAK